MEVLKRIYHKSLSLVSIVILVAAGIMPIIIYGNASAYGLITSRSITISSASNAASTATTTYATSFVVATTGTVQSMAVDVCSNDPIIGDSCTLPTGFSFSASAVTSVTTPGQTGLTWSMVAANSNRTAVLSTTGSVTGSVSAASTITFNITNVQNPTSAVGTYYARIFTFASTGNAATWAAASSGTGASTTLVIDAGGIALSTAQSITVTAKVQEQLTFCIGTTTLPTSGSAATPATLCSSLTTNTVALGSDKGVLSSSGPYVDVSTQYITGTNATGGAAIVLKGDTLKTGSNSIAALTSPAASSAGTSQFGLCTYSGSGSNLVFTNETTAYNNAGCTSTNLTQSAGYSGTGTIGSTGGAPNFALNTTNTLAATGDPFAKENAGANSTGIIPMLGNISTSQVAGIYTTTLSFIATGTY